MKQHGLVVAVVGATGAVGREMVSILEESSLNVAELIPLASERSRGEHIEFKGESVEVEVLEEDSFAGVDLALFSAGGAVSKKFAPLAVAAGCTVVDNTSAFRMDPDVPLVIPEVNAEALKGHHGLISNPNCSTIQMVVALEPLHRCFGLKRVVCSTYQSASGAGQRALDELRDQTVDILNFKEPKHEKFPRILAFDIIPQIGSFYEDGISEEERKMIQEPRKIMGLPDLQVSATCARVPVFICHAVSVNAEFEKDVDLEQARDALRAFPGVKLFDGETPYATARDVSGENDVYVGRLRRDPCRKNALDFWVVADNLRKGAALNSVQIAEALVQADILSFKRK